LAKSQVHSVVPEVVSVTVKATFAPTFPDDEPPVSPTEALAAEHATVAGVLLAEGVGVFEADEAPDAADDAGAEPGVDAEDPDGVGVGVGVPHAVSVHEGLTDTEEVSSLGVAGVPEVSLVLLPSSVDSSHTRSTMISTRTPRSTPRRIQ